MKHFLVGPLCFSLVTASFPVYAGQYSAQCQQAGQSAQQQCGTATSGANSGDASQAVGLGSMFGTSPNVNPGAGAMGDQATSQIGRLSSASNSCQQAQQGCEQKCNQQKQQAQGNPQAQQQGEPAQVDQAKQSSCSSPLAAMIGPLLAGLAAAMAALMAANATNGNSVNNPTSAASNTTTPATTTSTSVTPVLADGSPGFTNPALATGAATITAAGGSVSSTGVTMPDGSISSWSSLASGSGSGTGSGGTGLDGKPNVASASALATRGPASLGSGLNGGMAEGAGSGSSSNATGKYDIGDANFHFKATAKGKSLAKAVSGFSVNFQGNPIGTKGDDIFTMIHRAYDREKGANVFLEAKP